jgi:hypothetical protein
MVDKATGTPSGQASKSPDLEEIKVKPPIDLQGQHRLKASCVDVLVCYSRFIGMDPDGFARLLVRRVPDAARSQSSQQAREKLGSIVSKKQTYEVFRLANGFQVVGSGGTHDRKRTVSLTFASEVHDYISSGSRNFAEIRRYLGHKFIDAQHLKSVLAVLEVTGHIERVSDSNPVRYRKTKDWSLGTYLGNREDSVAQ